MSNKIIIFEEKHCNRYFAYKNRDEEKKIFFKIFKERTSDVFYYEEHLIEYFKKLIEEKSYDKIMRIILERKDHEYEGFQKGDLEDID